MRAAITGDWHIGKKSAKVDQAKEFRISFDWLIDEMKKRGLENILHTGDLFDSKRFISFDMAHTWRYVRRRLEAENINLFVVHGNHDVPNTKEMHVSLFDIAEDSKRVHNFGFVTEWKVDNEKVLFVPYGCRDEIEGSAADVDLIICHESLPLLIDGVPAMSGHIHQRSAVDSFNFIGTLYQLERDQVGTSTGFIEYNGKNSPFEWVDNPRETFRRVEVVSGKIEGLNPVKWVMNNRSSLAGANLEVKVDELTDKTLYQKLVAILETVALNDLVLTENIEFSQEPLKSSSHDVTSLISSELSRPGAKKRLEEIVGKLR